MKENMSGSCGSRSLTNILIPKDMNGVENSTTELRSDVIVMSQMAISAFCKKKYWQIVFKFRKI